MRQCVRVGDVWQIHALGVEKNFVKHTANGLTNKHKWTNGIVLLHTTIWIPKANRTYMYVCVEWGNVMTISSFLLHIVVEWQIDVSQLQKKSY